MEWELQHSLAKARNYIAEFDEKDCFSLRIKLSCIVFEPSLTTLVITSWNSSHRSSYKPFPHHPIPYPIPTLPTPNLVTQPHPMNTPPYLISPFPFLLITISPPLHPRQPQNINPSSPSPLAPIPHPTLTPRTAYQNAVWYPKCLLFKPIAFVCFAGGVSSTVWKSVLGILQDFAYS